MTGNWHFLPNIHIYVDKNFIKIYFDSDNQLKCLKEGNNRPIFNFM